VACWISSAWWSPEKGRIASVETDIEGARERFAVMGIGAWLGSAEQRLKLEREGNEL